MRLPRPLKFVLRHAATTVCRALLRILSRPCEVGANPIVVFAPHQDDETLGCGSLIARQRNHGHDVHVVFLTDGGASHPGHPRLDQASLVRQRRAEAMEALDTLGVDPADVHFWDNPDGTLGHVDPAGRARLNRRMSELIAAVKPGRVFVPCSPDGSSEHDPVLRLVVEAVGPTGLRPEIWQYPVWTWWNPGLLLGKVIKPGRACRLSGEDFQQHKRRALACYRTQVAAQLPWPDPALPPELAGFCLRDPEYFFLTPSTVWTGRTPAV